MPSLEHPLPSQSPQPQCWTQARTLANMMSSKIKHLFGVFLNSFFFRTSQIHYSLDSLQLFHKHVKIISVSELGQHCWFLAVAAPRGFPCRALTLPRDAKGSNEFPELVRTACVCMSPLFHLFENDRPTS